jgi:hypothetical protein
MKKIRASRQRLVAALAMIALVLSVGIMDSRNTASAGDDEPDFLVLNPENE